MRACAPQVDLSDNELGDEGAKALAPAIRDSRSLTSIGKDGIHLKDNQLGDEGWGAIFTGVCSKKDSKISSIDVSNESIGLPGAKLIAEALQKSVAGSLTSVRASPELQPTGPALTHFFLACTDRC